MEAFGGFGKRAAARNLANDALTLLLRTSCVLLAFQRIEASLINEKPCQRRTTIFAPCLSSSLYRLPQQQLQRSLPLHMEGSDNENESTVTLNDSISVEPTYYYYSPNVPLNNDRWNDATADQSEELAAAAVASASTTTSTNEYSFFDEAVIVVRAGSGGQGSATYKKAAGGQNGAPDGGSGGRGGSVILVTDPSLNTLAGLTNAWRPNSFGGSGAAASSAAAAATSATTTFRPKSFRADNGGDGERGFKNGAFGNDDIIRVPPGTVVQEQIVDRDTGTTVRIVDLVTLTAPAANDEDLVSATTSLLVARGGEGGEGSAVKNRGVRRPRAPPKGGERKVLKLTLKIVADVALVGVPNAGKSTFLAAVTRAKPKIANYPFTTIIPNLGVWVPPTTDSDDPMKKTVDKGAGSDGLVLCDVPGLIAGAARGVGLGHAFLRHVERCHVIVHLIDATSNDPVADYEMLNREILKYGTSQLAAMPQVVVVNKIDAFDRTDTGNDWEKGLQVRWSRDKLEKRLREVMPHSRLMWMSARDRDGVDDLMLRLASFVQKVKDTKAP